MSDLYSERNGRGPPLVLLHGWGMNLRVFDALRTGLTASHTVTALDLPGHGRSAWREDLTSCEELSWLAPQVPRDAILVGWSLGGQLALQLAADPRLAVHRLVLIASTPRFGRTDDWPHALPAAVLEQFATRLRHEPQQTIADFLALQVRGSTRAGDVLAVLKRALFQQGSAHHAALSWGLTRLLQNDLRELARLIRIPTLVIAGEHDRITSPLSAQALVELLPQGRLLTIKRAAHAPFLSHPSEVLSALLAHGAPVSP